MTQLEITVQNRIQDTLTGLCRPLHWRHSKYTLILWRNTAACNTNLRQQSPQTPDFPS